MNKYLLIDGSSMLATNYYGNLPKEIRFEKDKEKKKSLYNKILHTSNGVYTNAIYGMLKQLFRIIKKQKPTHIAIAFDKSRNTFRKEMFSDYKGNRDETPSPLKEQFVNMEQILTNMGFQVFFDDYYEADDIVGSLKERINEKRYSNNHDILNIENKAFDTSITYIITTDRDYLQLIDNNTKLWLVQSTQDKANELMDKYYNYEEIGIKRNDFNLPPKAFEVTSPICKEEFGVWPHQIPDLKGMQGDSSDNIPGIKGVSKAAIPLLEEYSTLENIIKVARNTIGNKNEEKSLVDFWKTLFEQYIIEYNKDKDDKEKIKSIRNPLKAILDNEDIGLLSKDLATIRTDYAKDYDINLLKFTPNNEKINQALKEYELTSLIDSFA